MIYGGIGEATVGGAFGGEKSLQSYIKSHPVETLLVGAYSGIKVYPFASGYLRTLGREKITYDIVPAPVVSGKQQFWSEGKGSIYDIAEQHKKLFTDSQYGLPRVQKLEGYGGTGKYVELDLYKDLPVNVPISPYHATGSVFWKDGKLVVGEDLLHVAPAVSANFLRIDGGGYSGFSLTSPFKRSGVLSPQINVRDIILAKGYEAQRGTYLWEGATPPSGKLVIPAGGKTEVQGLLLTGTEGELIQQKFYSTWKGVRYPIDEFKIVEGVGTTTKSPFIKDTKFISYSGLPSTSGGGYRGLGAVPSSSISTPSSSISSYLSSVTKGSDISTPSYTSLVSTPSKSSVSSYLSSVTKSSGRTPSSRVSTPSYSKMMSSVLPSASKRSKVSRTPSSYKPLTKGYSSIFRSYRRPSGRSSYSYGGSSTGGGYSYTGGGGGYAPFKFKPTKQPKSLGKFAVELRRFGKFKIIGYGRTQKEALGIGRTAAATGLGATFKVRGAKAMKIKGFRTKKTKEGIEFIEMRKYRLSKAPELKEIQVAKRRKKKKWKEV